MDFCQKYGPWALVTGASSGLGIEFARLLAARRLNLVLVARSAEPMERLAAELRGRYGIETRVAAVDLARSDFADLLAPAIGDIDIGLLVNNAGFGLAGDFIEHPLERELEMLAVNCRAPLILAHIVGRRLAVRGRGGMIVTASMAGFSAMPGMSHYAATKGFDLLLAEGLHTEWKRRGIDVLALCPGPTATGFGSTAGIDPGRLSVAPGPVAATALDRLGRSAVAVPGWLMTAGSLFQKLLPRRLTAWIIGLATGRMTRNG